MIRRRFWALLLGLVLGAVIEHWGARRRRRGRLGLLSGTLVLAALYLFLT